MLENIKGHIIVVMAPTGSGKGTLIKGALQTFPELIHTVSCTTRSMRPGEVDGKEYHFITQAEFEQKKADNLFLESAYFGPCQYGTLKSEILPRLADGRVVVTEIEVQGVEQLKSLIPPQHLTIVYIEAGGWDVLKERVVKRAPITEEDLAQRYERYLIEIESKDIANVVIENTETDFAPAKNNFNALVEDIMSRTYTD